MATKMMKKEIVVNQTTKATPGGINPIATVIGAKRLLDKEGKVSDKIAAMILTKYIMDSIIKPHLQNLEEQLAKTPYEDILQALKDEGVLADEETPIIVCNAIDDRGNPTQLKKAVTASTKKDLLRFDEFKAKVLSDPERYEKLPEDYKVHGIRSKSYFIDLFEKDKIDPEYRDSCEVVKTTETSLVSKK